MRVCGHLLAAGGDNMSGQTKLFGHSRDLLLDNVCPQFLSLHTTISHLSTDNGRGEGYNEETV